MSDSGKIGTCIRYYIEYATDLPTLLLLRLCLGEV